MPIGLLCAAPFMAVLDANLVTVALPSIGEDLGLPRERLQWVIGAYSLTFGSGLLVAGRAADRYGRRRLLIAGLAVFAGASLAGALAPSAAALLAARAVQGLGAAAAFPASLALIAALHEAGPRRTRAMAVYGAAVSAAFVAGMLAGGLLVTSAGWRAALLVNVSIGAVAAVATRRRVPEQRAGGPALGLPGALAAAGAVLALLCGLGGLPEALPPAALLATAAVLLERRSPAPLLPPALLRRREAVVAALAAFLTVGAGVGVMFVLTLHLQEVLGHDPAVAGLVLTPLGLAGIAAGRAVPPMAARVGLLATLAAALLVQAAAAALLGAGAGLAVVLAGSAAFGFGHFAATIAFTALATQGEEHGAAMGLIGSAQQIGGAVGLAVLVAIGSQALAAAACLSLLGAALSLAAAPRPARAWRTRPGLGRSSRR